MSVNVSQSEVMTVITITSNPKSKWPIFCQILGMLCYSPVCSISQDVKRKIMYSPSALGVVQIIVGILNIITGILLVYWGIHDYVMMYDAPFWLGGVFLISGILTILVMKHPSYFLLALAVIFNEGSGVLAMIGAALYSWDLMHASYFTAFETDLNTMRKTLDVVMIVFAVLQLCINITFVVLSLKECDVKNSVEDLQHHKLLLEEKNDNPAC